MKVQDRVQKLRNLMKENNLDAYIVPSSDSHLSEYVAEHFRCREWITGFTGSAGTAVITLMDAGLWTDGRYYIQAENQLKGSGIKLFKAGTPGVPTYINWLCDTLREGSCVGFDGGVFSYNDVKEMKKAFESKKFKLNINKDLIAELWEDRPAMPAEPIFVHDIKYAGKTRVDKLSEVRSNMKSVGVSHYLLTSLDDIAWLLNIRGNDVPNNPVTIANVVVAQDKCYLFINASKVSDKVREELERDGIDIKDYDETGKFLSTLESNSVMFDSNRTSARLVSFLSDKVRTIEAPNITTALKAIKNKVEIANLENCQVADGVAMVKFLKWLKTSTGKEKITEISAADKLEKLRRENELCVGLSFDTIAGYKDNAAMMHYKANEQSDAELKNEGFLLVDSGGQYYNGTTDITRTIVLGKLTEEEKRDFTLVLKSNISLNSVKFLYGATGSNVDIIARQPIWKYGLDYKCGTGHGVGFFLNVHEGPHGMSQRPNHVKLEDGMIITNEPGIYKEGKHGIRTENMMLVVKDEETEFGQFMKFKEITYCPIDLEGIVEGMLTEDEKKWLNTYHKKVYEKLSPYLNEEEKSWLRTQTREI